MTENSFQGDTSRGVERTVYPQFSASGLGLGVARAVHAWGGGDRVSAGAERLRVALSGVRGCALTTGDPAEAVAIGTAAQDTINAIRSRGVAEGMRELGRHAAAHQHINEVAHLRHQVGTLVRTL